MKKILALLLACIMLTAVLTGCGNKRASTETAAQPATAEQTDATASDGATYTTPTRPLPTSSLRWSSSG